MKKLSIVFIAALTAFAVITAFTACPQPTDSKKKPPQIVYEIGSGTPDASWTGGDITSPDQLAQLAILVNGGDSFEGETITLKANLDLSVHYGET